MSEAICSSDATLDLSLIHIYGASLRFLSIITCIAPGINVLPVKKRNRVVGGSVQKSEISPREEKMMKKLLVLLVVLALAGTMAFAETAESMEAVSYTHLDVYKRQSRG